MRQSSTLRSHRFSAARRLAATSALIAAMVAVAPLPRATAAPGDDPFQPLKIMFTAPKEDRVARGFIALVVAAYSEKPGLVLLEGGERDRIQAEIDLSETGMVDPDSVVRDRRLKPEVMIDLRVVEQRAGDAERPPLMHLEVKVKGPAGEVEFVTTLEAGNTEAIPAAFDHRIAQTLPEERRNLLLRGCLHEGWIMADLEGHRCAREIKAHCERDHKGRAVLACIAKHGAEVRRQVFDKDDLPSDLTIDELALVHKLKAAEGRFPELTEPEQKTLNAMAQNSQARREARIATFDRFRATLVETMNDLLSPRGDQIEVAQEPVETVQLSKAEVKEVRWESHQSAPTVLVTVNFKAEDREWTRDDFGTLRTFVDRLQSIGLRVMGSDGQVSDHRALTGAESRARGSFILTITSDQYGRALSLVPHTPQYRTERLD